MGRQKQKTSNLAKFLLSIVFIIFIITSILDPLGLTHVTTLYNDKILLFYVWLIFQITGLAAGGLGIANKKRGLLFLGIAPLTFNILLSTTLLKIPQGSNNILLISSEILLLMWIIMLAFNWKKYQ